MHFLILLFLVFVNAYTTWVYFVLFVLSNLHMNNHLSNYISIHGQVENLENSETFSEIFKSEFSIMAIGQNRKLGNKKTRNNVSEISQISEVSEFSICHFSFFKKLFFSIFYSRQFRTFYVCFALLSKAFKVLFPSPKIYVQNITLS